MTQRALVVLSLLALGASSCGEPESSTENDACDDNPCAHGSCEVSGDSFRCHCESGYEGARCDHNIDDCTSNACVNGSCVDGLDAYTCACDSGFGGALCDEPVDRCAEQPCAHGTCTDTGSGYTCDCDAGFTGTTCNVNIDDCGASACVNGSCVDGVGTSTCTCESGWAGALCDEPVTNCDDAPCVHGECTNTETSYSCNCDAGYDGANCDHNIDDCPSSDVCGHGVCEDEIEAYDCACDEGYRSNGTTCVDIDECTEDPAICGAHGTCENTEGDYTCTCDDAYDVDPSTRTCRALDACSEANGGCAHKCTGTLDFDPICACLPGFGLGADGLACDAADYVLLHNVGQLWDGTLKLDRTGSAPNYSLVFSSGAGQVVLAQAAGGYDRVSITVYDGPGFCADGSTSLLCPDAYRLCTLNEEGLPHRGITARKNGIAGIPSSWDGPECTWIVTEVSETQYRLTSAIAPQEGYLAIYDTTQWYFSHDENTLTLFENLPEIDECALGTDFCDRNASCTDDSWYFSCACNEGFTGPGYACTQTDMCATAINEFDEPIINGGCEHTCETVGSAAVCSCKLGFTLGADGKSCEPWAQGRITNLGLGGAWDGNYWQGSGRPLRLDPTSDGPNTYHLTVTKVPGTCANGLISNACVDEYRLCNSYAYVRSIVSNAQVGTPSQWESAQCTWIIEPVGGGQFRLKNLWEQQHRDYIDYVDCKHAYDCSFTNYDSTAGNTLFQIEEDVCAAGTSDCDPNATCTYYPGGYDCACKAGYDGDGYACEQVDPCVTNNGGCEQQCINDNGAPLCACHNGFTLAGDEVSCTPQTNVRLYNVGITSFLNVAAGALHFSATGSTVAIGKAGAAVTFTLSQGGHTYCLAADSSSSAASFHVDPSSTAGCTWLVEDLGAGRVRLKSASLPERGYLFCPSDNECYFTLTPDDLATFVIDPDECAQGADTCSAHATCSNTADGYDCSCNSGYSGDGRQCALQNGCVVNNGGCAQTCASTDAAVVTCGCSPGFDLSGDGHACVPWSHVSLFNSGLGLPLGLGTNGISSYLQFQSDAARVRMEPAAGAPNRFTFTAEETSGTDRFRLCAQSSSGYRWSTLRAIDGRPLPAGWNDAACVWEVFNLGGGHVRLKNLWLQQTVPYADYLNCALPYDCGFTYNESVAGNTDFIIDRDECAAGASGCSPYADCTNTAGSRACVCKSGFSGDGETCVSDDLCFEDNGGCDQLCTDTGAATCGCYPGFSLAANEYSCNPSGPTLLFNKGLGAYLGAAVAEQPPYALAFGPSGDAVRIEPATAFGHDVFTLTLDAKPGWCANGTVSQACVDHYRLCAVQRNGFRWDVQYKSDRTGTPEKWNDAACAWHLEPAGGSSVRLKNVWLQESYPYVDYLKCDQSYACSFTSDDALTGNTLFTVVTDECAAGTDDCSSLRACLPGPGGYTCGNCPAGYTNDGLHECADINECSQGTHGCDAHATCDNTPGGRTCTCNSGYTGSGTQCTALGPCETAACDQTCTVVSNAAQCGCLPGFDLGPDGESCGSWGLVSLNNVALQGDLAVHAEGSAASYPFVFREAGDAVRMEPTSDGPNTFTFTVPFRRVGCTGNNCQLDEYRLCARQDGGFRSHALYRAASTSAPAGWNDARCKWIVEPVGNDQVRLKNAWLQQAYPYVDYLDCWLEDDCVFTYNDVTLGNTLFRISPSTGDAVCQGVVCTAKDICHVAGVCNPTTGACDNPMKADGTTCGGIDACSNGVCFPGGDDDGDGVANAADGCLGNDASGDQDADDVCNDLDVCPSITNPLQADRVGDGIGDVCDKCPDLNAVTSNNDHDGDGIGDPCDPDFKLPGPAPTTATMPWRPTCGFVPQCPGTPAASTYNAYLFGCLASEPDGGMTCLSDRWKYLVQRRILTGVPGVTPAGTEALLDALEKPENNVEPWGCEPNGTCTGGRVCVDGMCLTSEVRSFIDRLGAASDFLSCTGTSSYENTWPADRVITLENGDCFWKTQEVYGYRVVNTTDALQTIWVGRGDSDADKRWWTLAPGENIKFNATRTVKLFATTASAYNVCQPGFMVRTVYHANLAPPSYSFIGQFPLVRYADGTGELVVYREKKLFVDTDLADYPNYFGVGITFRDPSAYEGILFKRDPRIKCE